MKRILLFFLLINFTSCLNKESKLSPKIGDALYKKAYNFWIAGDIDSAFSNFNRAKDIYILDADSLNVGNSLLCMGIIATNRGDYFGGRELSSNARLFLNEKKKVHYVILHRNYNNLAIASYKLKDYQDAINYYDEAIKFASEKKDIILYLNNKAKAYEDYGDYKEAITIYNYILEQNNFTKSLYAMVLANISFAKWLQNPAYNPVPQLLKSLDIRKKENDYEGQNFVYARLADYYLLKNPNLAKIYAEEMYVVAKKIGIEDDKLEALEKLVKLSSGLKSKEYFESYRNLEDSVQVERSKSKNQFAHIRYQTEQQKAKNLVLQKDVSEKKYQIISLIVGMLMIMVVSIILYKKRKQRMELASKNAIRENQLNTSKKVHDRVANRIYSVISEIENKKELDKDNLLDKLDHIYQTSRDISYEITDSQNGKKFSHQLSDMFYTYVADPPRVKIIGNDDEIWADVSNNTKGEIFIVLQELMTNMKKHSQATQVEVEFYKKDTFISIHYHDNGVGFPKDVIHHNGLRNTETRIKNISGTLTFETIDQLGLDIRISFPVN